MKFIKGDVVELITDEKAEEEGVNWAQSDGLPLNTPLIVIVATEQSGKQWIDLSGYIYSHPSIKFKLFNPTYEIF